MLKLRLYVAGIVLISAHNTFKYIAQSNESPVLDLTCDLIWV